MVRVVALSGAELGWRGQKECRKQFKRLQYQALRKCTGAVLGASKEKVNAIAGIEDVETILDAGQQRYIARCIVDLSTMEDIWEEATKSKSGKSWMGKEKDTWTNLKGRKRSDGYETIARRLLGTLDTSDTTKISWGQRIEKCNLQEVDLELTAEDSPNQWEHAIRKVDAIPNTHTPELTTRDISTIRNR